MDKGSAALSPQHAWEFIQNLLEEGEVLNTMLAQLEREVNVQNSKTYSKPKLSESSDSSILCSDSSFSSSGSINNSVLCFDSLVLCLHSLMVTALVALISVMCSDTPDCSDLLGHTLLRCLSHALLCHLSYCQPCLSQIMYPFYLALQCPLAPSMCCCTSQLDLRAVDSPLFKDSIYCTNLRT